ncbi:MAG TPA: HlyD family efflux transporter periplasmic adaptor subunit [Kofleriaceae bacterium]|nr:HlyD family efflux transporter periplasmic adaptor subunit [Kofleriaceae bacterium]
MIPDTSAMDRAVRPRRLTAARAALLVAIAGVVAVAGFALAPVVQRWTSAERSVDGDEIRIGVVAVGDLDSDLVAQGRVVAALHPTLFSPAQGIVALSVKAGAEVKKGDLLATVDSPALASKLAEERALLGSLESELGRAQIAARQARVMSKQVIDVLAVKHQAADRTLERTQKLAGEGALATYEVEKAADDLQLARFELDNARETSSLEKETQSFEIETRRLAALRQKAVVSELARQIGELRVTAPFDGLVAGVSVQDRDAVAAHQAILTVVNLSALEIELELAENQSAGVAPGTPAEIAYGGKTYPGRVVAIAPEVRDSQVRGTVSFSGEVPAGLRQNERVSVRLLLDRRAGVLKLPRGPYLEAGGGRWVYVVKGEVATRRAVQVGVTGVSEVEVVKGLAAGDKVVVSDTSDFEGAETVLIR